MGMQRVGQDLEDEIAPGRVPRDVMVLGLGAGIEEELEGQSRLFGGSGECHHRRKRYQRGS
jgi:hypothetical protein